MNILSRFAQRNPQTFLVLLTSIPLCIVYFDYLTFQKYFMFHDIGFDTVSQFFPVLVHMARHIQEEGLLTWSFSFGAGQNVYPGVFPIFDPFTLFAIAFGPENVKYTLIYTQMLQILFSVLFFFNLLRLWKLTLFSSFLFSLLVGFCHHLIGKGTWYHYGSEACLVLFSLYSLELLMQKRKCFLFAISVFLLASVLNFKLWVHSWLLVGYFVSRVIYAEKSSLNDVWVKFRRFTIYYVLGLGAATCSFVPVIYDLLNSPRSLGGESRMYSLFKVPWNELTPSVLQLVALLRTFAGDMLGHPTHYGGFSNYLEDPSYYSGLLVLVLLPQVLMLFKGKRRVLFVALMVLPFAYSSIEHIRFFLSGYAGSYFKISSFWITPLCLGVSAKVFDEIYKNRRVSLFLLVGTLLLLLSVLFASWVFPFEYNLYTPIRNTCAISLIIYVGLICAYKVRKLSKRGFTLAVLICAILEVSFLNFRTINRRVAYTEVDISGGDRFGDGTEDAVRFVKNYVGESNDFYRITRDYHSVHLSDALYYGYFGLESYLSVNQPSYFKFLKKMAVPMKLSSYINWGDIGLRRDGLQALLSQRFSLSKTENSIDNYNLIGSTHGISIFERNEYLSVGFTYDKYTHFNPVKKIGDLPTKDLALFDAVILENDRSPRDLEYSAMTELSQTNLVQSIRNRKKNEVKLIDFQNTQLKMSVSAEKPSILFLSIPYDKGWKLTIDGLATETFPVNIGFIGSNIDAGKHIVRVVFRPKNLRLYGSISFVFVLLFIIAVVVERKANRQLNDGPN